MNIVFLSPHFPENFVAFSVALSTHSVNVLGLGNEPYDLLPQKLKDALTEYYQVNDMENYDELLRALGYFTHRYGKIDRIDSLNEYWLDTEAGLRTDFNIPGIQLDTIRSMNRKSEMKHMFQKAGIPVAKGKIIADIETARQFIQQVGYPVVAKPDKGVGAINTFKLKNDTDLEQFFQKGYEEDYIFEEFIWGDIYSFDGLTDREGNIVFYTAHHYSAGIMETVNQDSDVYYYSLREIPADLKKAGMDTVRAFNLKERFFHIEFFRTHKDNQIVALEVNMRPPGGHTTDMFNYANDIDIYSEWANIMITNKFQSTYERKYHCAYVGRKDNKSYLNSHEAVIEKYEKHISFHNAISGIFSAALGNYGYLVRASRLEKLHEMINFIQAKKVKTSSLLS